MTMIYVLTLKTWSGYDYAYHTYGRIHWEVPEPCGHGSTCSEPGRPGWTCMVCGADHTQAGLQGVDSVTEPDAYGFATSRHETRESAIAGARRWFAENSKPGDTLLIGTWGLAGWESDEPFEVLEGEPIADACHALAEGKA